MNLHDINQALISGHHTKKGILPHVDSLHTVPFVFKPEFGLDTLPTEPGVLFIRGPRQYGKSTWLEQNIKTTLDTFGAGTALYINGDEIKDVHNFNV